MAVYSLRFYGVPFHAWPGMDPGIRGVIERAPLQALTHMLIAPIALLLGPFQFIAAHCARNIRGRIASPAASMSRPA